MNHRENIMVKLVSIVNGIDIISAVERQRPTMERFESLSDHLFPFAVVEAPGPKLRSQIQETRKAFAKMVIYKFVLPASIFIYNRGMKDQDTEFGTLYNALFEAIHEDILLGGLASSLVVEPDAAIKIIFEPYYAFRMLVNVNYETHGGI